MPSFKCKTCSKEVFVAYPSELAKRKFCVKCTYKSRSKKPPAGIKICPKCNKSFICKHPRDLAKRKYCSLVCYWATSKRGTRWEKEFQHMTAFRVLGN